MQGCDPCDSTAVKFSVANGHILQRDCRLTWASRWHFMSPQQCSHWQINKNSPSTESAEGIAVMGLQGFTIQFYYLAKYNCLLHICPRERTDYLRYIFLFFFTLPDRLYACERMFLFIQYIEQFWWLFAKEDNNVVVLVSVYFSHLFSKPVSRLPIDLVQPVKFYSLHLRRLLFEIHEGLLIRTNCEHQVHWVTLPWPIGLREHEGLISWLIKLSVREASQTNEH